METKIEGIESDSGARLPRPSPRVQRRFSSDRPGKTTEKEKNIPVSSRPTKILRLSEWALLLLIGLWGWNMRRGLAPIGVADPDSWGYLMPAMSAMSGLGLVDVAEREWLYSAFIAMSFGLTGSMSGYILIQQILSLAAIVPMWLAWRSWISFLPDRNLLADALASLPGLLVVVMYLLNPATIGFEISIRPEALFALVSFTQLWCILSYCKFRWREPDMRKALLFGALALPLAYAMFKLKPSWALAVPFTTCPVFFGLFPLDGTTWRRALVPAAGFLLILLTLWLPDRLFFIRGEKPRVVLAMTLFTMNADSIRASLAERLEQGRLPPEKEALVRDVLPNLDLDIANARAQPNRTYKTIGFDPDYIMYRASLFPALVHEHRMSTQQIIDFCYWSYFQAWLDHPEMLTRKIATQFALFFRPDNGTFFLKRFETQRLYAHIATVFSPEVQNPIAPGVLAAYQEYFNAAQERGKYEFKIVGPKLLFNFSKPLAAASPYLITAFLAALPAVMFWKRLQALRFATLTALLIFSAPFGNALTVSLVHALDNSRYRQSYGPLLAFALAAIVVILIAMIRRLVARKPALPSAPPLE